MEITDKKSEKILSKKARGVMVLFAVLAFLFAAGSIACLIWQNYVAYTASGNASGGFWNAFLYNLTGGANPYNQASNLFYYLRFAVVCICDFLMIFCCLAARKKSPKNTVIPEVILFIFSLFAEIVLNSIIFALAGIEIADVLISLVFQLITLIFIATYYLGAQGKLGRFFAKLFVVLLGVLPFLYNLVGSIINAYQNLTLAKVYLTGNITMYKLSVIALYICVYVAQAFILALEIVCIFDINKKQKKEKKVVEPVISDLPQIEPVNNCEAEAPAEEAVAEAVEEAVAEPVEEVIEEAAEEVPEIAEEAVEDIAEEISENAEPIPEEVIEIAEEIIKDAAENKD